MNIGIIGCGLIGHKRANHLDRDDRVVMVCDRNEVAGRRMGDQYGCPAVADWRALVADPAVEAVVIAASHDSLVEPALDALRAGKHILIEKPGARNVDELEPLLKEYKERGGAKGPTIIKIGFNHRFHPAAIKAREILASGAMGELMFVRGRYGHGGRPGYDREWRAQPEVSGGGELLDQGMHLIDLSRCFLGDLDLLAGETRTYFWDMPVDDNAFLLLGTEQRQVSQLHVSWTEWKNLFSLEIYGRDMKLHWEGLGGSYGVERLAVYTMKPEMGPPETVIHEFPGPDTPWRAEWSNFKGSIAGDIAVDGGLEDAFAALKIVKQAYGRNP